MTDIERGLLDNIQRDFPLDPHPFHIIGERLGISENECVTLLRKLYYEGVLRAIRPVLSWNKLGFSTILIGMRVQPGFIEQIVEVLNSINGITHNYERDGQLNIWFTLIYESVNEKVSLLTRLKYMQGVEDIKEFNSEKTYKIGLVLDV